MGRAGAGVSAARAVSGPRGLQLVVMNYLLSTIWHVENRTTWKRRGFGTRHLRWRTQIMTYFRQSIRLSLPEGKKTAPPPFFRIGVKVVIFLQNLTQCWNKGEFLGGLTFFLNQSNLLHNIFNKPWGRWERHSI